MSAIVPRLIADGGPLLDMQVPGGLGAPGTALPRRSTAMPRRCDDCSLGVPVSEAAQGALSTIVGPGGIGIGALLAGALFLWVVTR